MSMDHGSIGRRDRDAMLSDYASRLPTPMLQRARIDATVVGPMRRGCLRRGRAVGDDSV